MAYKQKGYTPYTAGNFSQPGKTPYKFLGKLVKGIGKGIGGAVKGIGGVLGLGGGGGQSIKMTRDMMRGGSGFLPPGGFGGMMGMGGRGHMPFPFLKKEKGYTPYKKSKFSSPMKTDAILVKGSYDAASGKGTSKYGMIAPTRAWTDMVDSVEKTVNRSSKAQLAKDRRRAKRTVRSHDRYADWAERQARREHERDRHKQGRRDFRDRYRKEVWGKPPTLRANYQGSGHPQGDYSHYWGQGSGYTKKEKGYTPYKSTNKK